MTLNARMSADDKRWYNAGRDVAYCFGDAMREVINRVESGKWEALQKYLKAQNVTEAELGKAANALALFIAGATEVKKETMAGALTRAGFFDQRDEATIAVTSLLGTVMMGYFYAGAKQVTLGGEGPCDDYQDLRGLGAHCSRMMALPRWKRPFYRFADRCFRIWSAIRSA